MQTSLKNITQLQTIYEDLNIEIIESYDQVKKSYCILSLPKNQTSWTHSIDY